MWIQSGRIVWKIESLSLNIRCWSKLVLSCDGSLPKTKLWSAIWRFLNQLSLPHFQSKNFSSHPVQIFIEFDIHKKIIYFDWFMVRFFIFYQIKINKIIVDCYTYCWYFSPFLLVSFSSIWVLFWGSFEFI